MRTGVLVVGGGVAGLNTARLLIRAGAAVELVEARERLGGRVLSVDGLDLGPSWIWPGLQPAIANLIEVLGVGIVPQSSDGDVVFERMSREPAHRYPGLKQEAASFRIAGGAVVLVRALAAALDPERVHRGQTLTRLDLGEDGVVATIRSAEGSWTVTADQVVLAVPPRLLEASVEFSTPLGAHIAELWRETPTWMASQAKFVAVYDEPFWLDDGLSGTAQSMVGPMLEMHDATTSSGSAALFGFLGVGPAERDRIGEEGLTRACLAQFARIFGPRATEPIATHYVDWATDALTSTRDDLVSTGHPAHVTDWVGAPWDERIVLAGSETSPHEAGYLSGAAEASTLAAAEVLRRLGVTASVA